MKNFILLSCSNFFWSNLRPLRIALPLHILVKTTHFLKSPFRYRMPALNPIVSLISRVNKSSFFNHDVRDLQLNHLHFFCAMKYILYWFTYCVNYASFLKLDWLACGKTRSVKAFVPEWFTTSSTTSFFLKELLKFQHIFAFRFLNFGNRYLVLDGLLEK